MKPEYSFTKINKTTYIFVIANVHQQIRLDVASSLRNDLGEKGYYIISENYEDHDNFCGIYKLTGTYVSTFVGLIDGYLKSILNIKTKIVDEASFLDKIYIK
jgi:hypothetical protein